MDNLPKHVTKKITLCANSENMNRSKTNLEKNYNKNIFFGAENKQNKENTAEYKKQITQIINDVLSRDQVEIGNNYLPSDNTPKVGEEKKSIDSNSLFKKLQRGSTFKLNLNISNNYYTSNHTYTNEITEKRTIKSDKQQVKEKNDNQERPSRLTVFLKRIFFGEDEVIINCSNKNKDINLDHNEKILRKLSMIPEDKAFHIPCINCNTLVHVNDIESHSNSCIYVKSEVYQVETINNGIQSINYKLWKLEENLSNIKNSKKIENGQNSYYILTVLQYIQDSLSKDIGVNVTQESVEKLKKIVLNFETLTYKFKGTLSTQILVERAKYLINEKLKLTKLELKKNKHKINKSFFDELETSRIEKEHIVDKLNLEKEILKGKVQKLKKAPRLSVSHDSTNDSMRVGTNIKPKNLKFITEVVKNEESSEDDFALKSKQNLYNNVIDEINSDLDNMSVNSGYSEMTSNTISKLDINGLSKNLLDEDSQIQEEDKYFESTSNFFRTQTSNMNSYGDVDVKSLYKDFVKIVLKTKFEKIGKNSISQKIPEKVLFKECLKKEVPKDKFSEFIIEELKNPEKYIQFIEKNKATNKTKFNRISVNRISKYLKSRPLMDIINEESF